MKLPNRWWLATGSGAVMLLAGGLAFFPGRKVDFNTEVRPILNTRCIACHGGVKQSGNLSFITREEALRPAESGLPAIVPGDPDRSEMIRRIVHHDPEERMPLDHSPLAPEEVRLLRRWISQGAHWAEHWAFIPPDPAITPPKVSQATGIDAFINDRLRQEGLTPAPEADKVTLMRRVSLDLTGLPPTPAAVDSFLRDSLPGSYERLVDRLLASPHYGERWTALWMDLARYADSKGYEKDPHRDIWPYRDWLIRAFNADMPFDQFTVEQLAGDLLPAPTPDQLVATAFHRNTLTNTEGGTDDEEFRLASVMDRVRTTWTVWQGMTMECVQCHSHPYEPLRHQEYYQFMAFFNNTQDNDLDGEFPVAEIFHPKDTADFAGTLRWLQSLAPGTALSATPHASQRIREVMYPRLIPRDCDDFREVTLYGDGAAANWVHNLQSGSKRLFYLRYNGLSFDQISHISVTYGAQGREGLIELRTDAPDGPLLAAIQPGSTGQYVRDNEGWWDDPDKTVTVPINRTTGTHDLFVLLHNTTGKVRDGIVVLKELELTGPGIRRLTPQAQAAQDSLLRFRYKAANVPVMRERIGVNARPTRIFERGNWMTPGEVVMPGVPAIMPQLPQGQPADRLAMARWLVSPDNPLTARVTVNRFWEQLFGVGLVETLEDFGSQGAPPSHPALLDWLATRFVLHHHWQVKPLLREMVLSATYRQAALVTPEKREKDPYNRLLSRGPRFRLTAEQVRDQLLVVSGLWTPRLYGPSVMPYQPDGIWTIVYSGDRWIVSDKGDAYRRALYTYWRRSNPYPSMLTFDAAARDVCQARRIRTNTPLQALTTLNDPVCHEAAVALAEAMHTQGGIAYGYQRALLAPPSPETLIRLQQLYEDARAYFDQHPREAVSMACNEREDSTEIAALAVVANAIMNLDAFLTK